MKPELIVMLTHRDKTVENALQLFDELKMSPVKHWGFKDIGLPLNAMKVLVDQMKRAGKITYLEVVSLTEEDGKAGAQLAVEAGFDVLMGTVFYDSILNSLMNTLVKYYPFPGQVYGHPSILGGSIQEIVQHAQSLEAQGVDGLDLLAYRFNGNATELLQEVVKATHIPVVCAGSIASFDRITEVWEAGVSGFTIGSAFFERQFVPDGDFRANMMAVWNWIQQTEKRQVA